MLIKKIYFGPTLPSRFIRIGHLYVGRDEPEVRKSLCHILPRRVSGWDAVPNQREHQEDTGFALQRNSRLEGQHHHSEVLRRAPLVSHESHHGGLSFIEQLPAYTQAAGCSNCKPLSPFA